MLMIIIIEAPKGEGGGGLVGPSIACYPSEWFDTSTNNNKKITKMNTSS
jgi:hypothetical protein